MVQGIVGLRRGSAIRRDVSAAISGKYWTHPIWWIGTYRCSRGAGQSSSSSQSGRNRSTLCSARRVQSGELINFFNGPRSNILLQPNPAVRAEHRYLDLRRPALSANLRKRSRVSNIIRTRLNTLGTRLPCPLPKSFNASLRLRRSRNTHAP